MGGLFRAFSAWVVRAFLPAATLRLPLALSFRAFSACHTGWLMSLQSDPSDPTLLKSKGKSNASDPSFGLKALPGYPFFN